MKKAIPAIYNNDFKIEFRTNNEEVKEVIYQLQFIFDNNIYSESLRLYTKKYLKGGMFSVIFEFDDTYFSFTDIVKIVYENYMQVQKEKEELEAKLYEIELDKREITCNYANQLADLTTELLEEIEQELGTEDPDIVLPILDSRFKKARKEIDFECKKELINFEKTTAELFAA